MNLKRIIYTITNLVITVSLLSAQEVLYDLTSNSTLIKLSKNKQEFNAKSSTVVKSLELPFIDDFSGYSIYPDSSKWTDNSVLINSTYAINPPSIGVATFDALNNNGNVYENANENVFEADQLTSQEINLNYPVNSNIVFSFFYQPQGRGNEPEFNDSLTLEFKLPGTVNWNRVWKENGTGSHPFKQVMIQIDDTSYLKDGFKFRFKNYVSLNIESSPGMNANADHWHIDYVRIDKGRSVNDTVLRDICFVYPIESIIPQYESMPWNHFFGATFTEIPRMYFKYSNRDTALRKVICKFEFTDLIGNSPSYTDTSVRNSNIEYNELIEQDYKTDPSPDENFFYYQDNGTDIGLFEIKAFLDIDEIYDYPYNDTIYYYQKFSNYYAYDDGSPENGYGILSKNAKIAYQFEAKQEGALEAIQIYFNPSKDSYTNGIFFYLTVWDDIAGEPGDTLYQEIGTSVQYADSLDGYYEYKLTHEIIVSGNFYIGLQQTTVDMLNIGYDINRNAKDKLFYNIDGTWKNTQFSGALMMRPVFGEPDLPKELKDKTKKVTVGPIPSNDIINLWVDGKLLEPGSNVIIYNQYGQLLINTTQLSNTMNISHLFPGIYIIKVINTDGNIATGKFIVVH